jgi:hypothetical protein
MYFGAADEKFAPDSSEADKRRKELLLRAFAVPVSDTVMIQHLRQVCTASHMSQKGAARCDQMSLWKNMYKLL